LTRRHRARPVPYPECVCYTVVKAKNDNQMVKRPRLAVRIPTARGRSSSSPNVGTRPYARDLFIRLALGGSRRWGWRSGQGMTVAAGWVDIGALTALVLARLTSSLLFGVRSSDPGAFLGIALYQFGESAFTQRW